MKKQIISFTLVAAGFLLGATALSALASGNTWTAPTQSPPNGNVAAPINVGPDSPTQVKTDSLQINGSLAVVNDLIVSGNLNLSKGWSSGYVLTASGANGAAVWLPAGGSGGSSIVMLANDTPIFTGDTAQNYWQVQNINALGIVPAGAKALIVRGTIDFKGDQNGAIAVADMYVKRDINNNDYGKGVVHAQAHLIAQEGSGDNFTYVGSSGMTIVPIDSTKVIYTQVMTSGAVTSLSSSLYLVGYVL